jgi:hypothetical protein
MKKTEEQLLKELRISAKKDMISKFAQKYIVHILICLAIIIILMLSFTLYSFKNKKRQQFYSEKFNSAIENLQKNNVLNGMEILEKIYNDKKASREIRSIAGLKLAGLESFIGNNEKAVKRYKEIYKNDKKPSFLNYLAGNSAATLMINRKDQNQYEEIDKLLNELTTDKNPFKNLALEQKGVFELQKGNLENGIKILNSLLENAKLDQDSRTRIFSIIRAYKQ